MRRRRRCTPCVGAHLQCGVLLLLLLQSRSRLGTTVPVLLLLPPYIALAAPLVCVAKRWKVTVVHGGAFDADAR